MKPLEHGGLAPETFDEARSIAEFFGQSLDRDSLPVLDANCFQHHGHATAAMDSQNVEARGEGVGRCVRAIVQLGSATDLFSQNRHVVLAERRLIDRAGIGDATMAEVDPVIDPPQQCRHADIRLREKAVAEAGAEIGTKAYLGDRFAIQQSRSGATPSG
ncbi:MAG: hypothetical protein QF786_12780 [Vicinamibacterales bacterium]|jgi:hypothetical protein|nr:hypothetical protein [Vicinamibacterales bacterium]